MKISIKELSTIYTYIEKWMLKFSDDEVELPNALYWSITSDKRENILKTPTLCIGSLVDDWQELQKLSQRDFATIADVDRLANVLIALGEAILRQDLTVTVKKKNK